MISQKLKELRQRNAITQAEFARDLNVSLGAVGNWETGNRKPDSEMLDTIADYFGVTVDYILGRTDVAPMPRASNIIPLPKMRRLPLVGDIACGTPILADENVETMIDVPDSITADFCLRCKGDSMIGARIHDGDIVYIKQQDDVDDGQIAAVLIDDEATLKRVYRQSGNVILQAENPVYKPMIYTAKDARAIRILGLAVAFTSVIK